MEKQVKSWLFFAMALLGVSGLTILFMPLAAEQMFLDRYAFPYTLAAVFWLATIGGYLCFFRARSIGIYIKDHELSRNPAVKERKTFPFSVIGRTRPGLVCNIVFLASILGYCITQVFWKGPEMLGYIFISLFILSFHGQIICNSGTFDKYDILQKGMGKKE